MTTITQNTAQLRLMSHLKAALPDNISLVEELADLLQLSNDSAYRRIRGETTVSIDELAVICKYFKLSFDTFIGNNDTGKVTFSYHRLNSGEVSYKDYLLNVLKDLQTMLSFDEKKMIYAAEDIPVFYQFHHPELAAFKMFYWQKSIMGLPEFENKQFDLESIDPEIIKISEQILECYLQIPSVEIWNDETVNSTLMQIEFYWDAGILKSKEDALAICDHVGTMFENIVKQAETSKKGLGMDDNYALYQSDVMIGTNCIIVETNGIKSSYLSFHTFNTMSTSNAHFCDETDIWLNNLLKKSNLISGVAEKQRYKFFKRINNSLQKLRDKILED
ncbi:MAG: transcriptional regulator with XRE-family HTH domain [Flavobacteriales bacterium]|jgi:transcriptional regulator with XRE-family HTH domain